MRQLLKLNLHSRRVCFLVETEHCCGDIITDTGRFSIQVKKDSIKECSSVLINYPLFDSDDYGRMCLLLDDEMKELCQGRYVFEIMLDECVLVKAVKFLWGGTPVVTDIKLESSPDGECYDETGAGQFDQSPLVEACCDGCSEEDECESDPCNKCDCDPCGCGRVEYHDPEELLKRDC